MPTISPSPSVRDVPAALTGPAAAPRPAPVLALLAAALLAVACAEDPVGLLSSGHSQHRIVLQPEASPSERHAADELKDHFLACTGVELPILEGDPGDGAPMIVLGRGPVAQRLGVDPSDEKLGDQGFELCTVVPHLVIAGTPQAGTLYGVHRFLEEYLGVRWYAPGVTLTPPASDLRIPPTRRVVRPAFFWRHTSYRWPGADADFLARMGDNFGDGGPDNPQGVQYDQGGGAHTYLRFVSPDEFFNEHPEYFSEIGGQRIREDTQLCLTNPDVLEIVTERMLAKMEAEPGAHQFTFSQMDYYNQCQCQRCREINQRYGTAGGTQFWFANQLAERTSQVHPDKLIRTLAYTYTEEPPQGLQMHPNVAIWLCHMFPSCDSHPIERCGHNADYLRRARAWSKISSHLYVWHYTTNFTHYYVPFPNLRALAADARFYRDIGVEGVFLQGMGHSGGGGEFSLLRPWYGMQLLWDPDRNPQALLDDFGQGYYGAAWGPIREYIDLLHDKVERDQVHMHLYTNPAQGYLTDEIVEWAGRLFDRAENAVTEDPELLERVRVARMPLAYARMFPRNGYQIDSGQLHWRGEIATLEEVLEFIDRMQRHGFETVREVQGSADTLLLVSGIVSGSLEVATLANPHLTVDVVPVLAGRALQITERSTGRCVTAHDNPPVLFFPFCGGLEDRVGENSSFYGWVEPAQLTARSERSVTVALDTFDGFALRRTLTLEPDRPVLVVESELTNPGAGPREARLRSHMELDLGDLFGIRVGFTDRGGQAQETDLTEAIAGLREGQAFFDLDAPAGAWTFTDSQGRQLTQRFDDTQVEHTWLYAYPDSLGQLDVELWTPRVLLQPGENVRLRQEIEISRQ